MRRRPIILLFGLALLTAWTSVALLGGKAASLLAARFGAAILRLGKGKISDPAAFVEGRLSELLWLAAVAYILVSVCWLLIRQARARAWPWREGWIITTLAAFAAVNIFLLAAMQTAFFWGSLFAGERTSNFTQFNFKKILLKETAARRTAILMGSSQTQAQLDENLLNERLGKTVWTSELHFPGSAALDLLITLRRLENTPGDDLICYLSENYFYADARGETAPFFLKLSDTPTLARLDVSLFQENVAFGLLGHVLPAFRCREPLTQRMLGPLMSSLAQQRYDAGLQTNLLERAAGVARQFSFENAPRQKRAFEEYLREAARQNRRVIGLEGKLNPLLQNALPRGMRDDYRKFLAEMERKYPHFRLVREEQMPAQSPDDYDDLTHVNARARAQFTRWFARWLESTLSHSSTQSARAE